MKEFVLVKVCFNNGVPYMLFAKKKDIHYDLSAKPRLSMFGTEDHKDPQVVRFTSKSDALAFRDQQVDYDWQVVATE